MPLHRFSLGLAEAGRWAIQCHKFKQERIRMLQKIMSNGFVLVIPIIIWNGFLSSKLPEPFSSETFDRGIPYIVRYGENIFRIVVFLMPVVLKLNFSTPLGKTGFGVYFFGILLYALSWLLLIYAPTSTWSSSFIGICAPAYIPVIWFVGISLAAESYYFDAVYSRWHFLVPAACFSFFHILHAASAYSRIEGA